MAYTEQQTSVGTYSTASRGSRAGVTSLLSRQVTTTPIEPPMAVLRMNTRWQRAGHTVLKQPTLRQSIKHREKGCQNAQPAPTSPRLPPKKRTRHHSTNLRPKCGLCTTHIVTTGFKINMLLHTASSHSYIPAASAFMLTCQAGTATSSSTAAGCCMHLGLKSCSHVCDSSTARQHKHHKVTRLAISWPCVLRCRVHSSPSVSGLGVGLRNKTCACLGGTLCMQCGDFHSPYSCIVPTQRSKHAFVTNLPNSDTEALNTYKYYSWCSSQP